jgi:hypothetical protein
MNNPKKDQFGFYQVADLKTYSKLEAIELSKASDNLVTWNFNRNIFDHYNWFVEPVEPLKYWYRKRAEQIREKYDYVVIWFSGGADSHNVLMSFVENNIFVDEIAHLHNYAAENGNTDTFFNQEIFKNSIPFTADLIQNNPTYRHTVHRPIDITHLQCNTFLQENNNWDYFYKLNTLISPNKFSISTLRDKLPEYKKLIDEGKKVCFVWGIDKPKVLQTADGTWIFQFNDFNVGAAVQARQQELNFNYEYDELFYWAPDLPELIAKQVHTVKNYLTKFTPDLIDNVHFVKGDIGSRDKFGKRLSDVEIMSTFYYKTEKISLTSNGLHKIIYPHWRSTAIVAPKPTSTTMSERDYWFFNKSAPNLGQKYFYNGLLKMKQTVSRINPEYWYEYKFLGNFSPYIGGLKPMYNSYTFGKSQQN